MITNCPNCGAPVDLKESKCPYCGTPYDIPKNKELYLEHTFIAPNEDGIDKMLQRIANLQSARSIQDNINQFCCTAYCSGVEAWQPTEAEKDRMIRDMVNVAAPLYPMEHREPEVTLLEETKDNTFLLVLQAIIGILISLSPIWIGIIIEHFIK